MPPLLLHSHSGLCIFTISIEYCEFGALREKARLQSCQGDVESCCLKLMTHLPTLLASNVSCRFWQLITLAVRTASRLHQQYLSHHLP